MARKSELNPRERMGLFLIDERPDRVPLLPLITSYAARVAGFTIKEYCTDGRAMAKAHLTAYKRFKHDALMLFSDVGMVAEAYGSRYGFPENDVPTLDTPLVADDDAEAGCEELELPSLEAPGRWGVYYQAIESLYDVIADRVPILAFVPAPFTTAAGLRGVESLLVDLIVAPQQALAIIERASIGVRKLLDGVMERGALPVLVDPLASGSVLSPEQFHQFALPFLQRAIQFLHRYDMDVMLHICGRTEEILGDIPATGADLFSFDDVTLASACSALGDRVRMVGNLRPAEMLNGSTQQIAQQVAQALTIAKGAPKGYALSTGCEVPVDTPIENMEVFMEVGRREGVYA